jgi:hypothetical protein
MFVTKCLSELLFYLLYFKKYKIFENKKISTL